MKRVLSALLLFATFPFLALAQQPVIEYGQASELKGVTKIYIHTGMDLELHEKIAKDIKKKLPDLLVCDKPEDAEVFLVFNTDFEPFLAGISSRTNSQSDGYVHATGTTYGDSTTMNGTYSGQSNSTTTSNAVYGKFESGSGSVFKRINQNRFRVIMSFKDSRKVGSLGLSLERKPRSNFAREFVEAYSKANK